LIFGSSLAIFHLIWSILVLTGVAQIFIDFIFWLHMMRGPYIITRFTITQSLSLIVVTFVIGYLMGYIVAWLWNKFNTK
ncbi:hypothetical protein KKB58_01465, partial [Patescibacteria group bacterium]|nr:hypothetical protein [Patescibacteria group bacterium]